MMKIGLIKSSKVCGSGNYILGVAWGGRQIRIGLIWWHVVILLKY